MPDSDWVAPPLPSDTGGPVLEGPARSPGLRAIATATAGRVQPRSVSKAQATPPGAAIRASGARRRPSHLTVANPPSWGGGRRPLLTVLGLTFIALVALAANVALTRPVHALPWAQEDPQFITDSNQLCSDTLPQARLPAAPGITAGTPTPSYTAVAQWAKTVSHVADQIGALSSAPDEVGRLNVWLADWRTYSADEGSYANWLRFNSGHTPANTGSVLAAKVRSDSNRADSFANDNGLTACTLGPPSASAASATSPS